jgi:hypothetical protein
MTGVLGALPEAWADLEGALRARRPVLVYYHGRWRLICPHALGWKDRKPMLLGYQTGGETSTGALPADPTKRWRCFFVDEVEKVVVADQAAPWVTADNYNASHPFNAIDYISVAVPGDVSKRC